VDVTEAALASAPRFELLSVLPRSLEGWLLEFQWDVERLWRLNLPTVSLQVADLTWHLLLPWWRKDELVFQVSPMDVWHRPFDHPEHASRTEACDLSYPIAVTWQFDRWLILDGIHRLLKACLLALPTVDARILSKSDLVKIARKFPRPFEQTTDQGLRDMATDRHRQATS